MLKEQPIGLSGMRDLGLKEAVYSDCGGCFSALLVVEMVCSIYAINSLFIPAAYRFSAAPEPQAHYISRRQSDVSWTSWVPPPRRSSLPRPTLVSLIS
jgi:hypothetical protein